VVLGANRLDAERYASARKDLRERLRALPDGPFVRYRSQDGGDYDARGELRADLAPGGTGLGVHVRR
jgi:NAD(P)H dehydrogenase (quinone)